MTKGPSKDFGVDVNVLDENGKPIYNKKCQSIKKRVCMEKGWLHNENEQDFYFPDDHPEFPRYFKGMAWILKEWGYNVTGKKAQCGRSFSECPKGASDCCCRRTLYNQPDFANVESILESVCRERNVPVVFLPEFHCELNPIEQVWGAAKRYYRLLPPSSKFEDLCRNLLEALESISVDQMRRSVSFTNSCTMEHLNN